MAKQFNASEKHILGFFQPGTSFVFKGQTYTVLCAAKPTCPKGEPKTDIFVQARSAGGYADFKISYKQSNADFIENKMNAERAALLFGADWARVIGESTKNIAEKFAARPLIYRSKLGKTNAGSITLGWKFELLRVLSGELSGEMLLTHRQKVDVYAGTNLPQEKRDAYINGVKVAGSGVAEYIFEEFTAANSAQDVMDSIQTIDEFLQKYPKIYFACKALNYRSLENKYDGNRPLSVYVEWRAADGKLCPTLKFDAPLTTCGNAVYAELKKSLAAVGVRNTNGIDAKMLSDPSVIV